MIRITKFAGAYMVQATRPDVKKPWASLLPMSARGVVEGLIRHGASLPGAFAAMRAADPYGFDRAVG